MYLRLFLKFLSCLTGLLLQVTAILLRQNSATLTRLYSPLSLPSAGTPACHFSLNFRISLCRTQEKQAGIFIWNFVKRIIWLREIRLSYWRTHMSLHVFKPTFVSFGNVLQVFFLRILHISNHQWHLSSPPLYFTTNWCFVYTKAMDHGIRIFHLHNKG